MNMRATRKIFCHLESFSSRDDKKSWGWLSYSYTTSILWNNGFVSRSTTQENMLQSTFTVTHESTQSLVMYVLHKRMFFSLSLLATAINSARLDTSTLPSVSDSEYINIIYWGNIWRKRLNETKSTKLENSFSCSTGVWTLAYAQRFCQINNKDKRVLTSVKCHEF